MYRNLTKLSLAGVAIVALGITFILAPTAAKAETVECGAHSPPLTCLTAEDVQQIISAGVQEAAQRETSATIVVTDRVGNVLAVFRIFEAKTRLRITTSTGIPPGNGLERIAEVLLLATPKLNVDLTDTPGTELGAMAKALTAAYLSSSGNAFSTRNLDALIQPNSGVDWFGALASQLPCSDLMVRFATNAAVTGFVDATAGPKRSPLGLAAEPGGLALYKNGSVVGGVGVEAIGPPPPHCPHTEAQVHSLYTVGEAADGTSDVEEAIAVAARSGFEPPAGIRGAGAPGTETVVGPADLLSNPAEAPLFDTINGVAGILIPVTGYTAAATIAGQEYGDPESGFAEAAGGLFDAVEETPFVLHTAAPVNRYPPIDSLSPTPANAGMTAEDVEAIMAATLQEAIDRNGRIGKAGISAGRVAVSVVDRQGNILGMAMNRDTPIFAVDTALQLARTAAFFSDTQAGAQLRAYDSSAALAALGGEGLSVPPGFNLHGIELGVYADRAEEVLGPTILAGTPLSSGFVGDLSHPGGPFSPQQEDWSPFNSGLPMDSVIDSWFTHLVFVETGAPRLDSDARCTFFPLNDEGVIPRLANGMQTYPGGFPIYRGSTLIGALAVSGAEAFMNVRVALRGLERAGVGLSTVRQRGLGRFK